MMNMHAQNYRRRLYRSRHNRLVMGVCGGLAEHIDMNATALRVLAFFAILLTLPWGLLVYFIVGLVLKPEPEVNFGSYEEEELWHQQIDAPEVAMERVKRRFEQLDRRLQRMESIVTSRNFDLENEFKNL